MATGVPMDIQGYMRTVLLNIMDDFKRLCYLVPIDRTKELHDPDVPVDQKKWILLRAPWQPKLPNEDMIPRPPPEMEPPRWCADRYKAVMSQWFFKDTLATRYEQ